MVLFMGCHMPNHPTDAIHRHNPMASVLIRNAFQTANKFTAGKTKLGYEWVSHVSSFRSLLKVILDSDAKI
jgi:hypothetical protein